MPGGIGGGINSQGVPVIAQLVDHFAREYEVVVYMYAQADDSYSPPNFKIHFPPKWITISTVRWLYLIFVFVFSHFKKKHLVLFSFWGYPSGAIVTLLSKIISKPSIVYLLGGESANLPEINYGLMRKKSLRKIILWACNHCTMLLAVSQFQVDQLKKFRLKRDALVIPWGSDKNRFFPKKKNRTLPLKIIHVANLNEVKDQSMLIKAFALIREKVDAKLRIVGPDLLDGKIQRLVADMNLDNNVEFTGGVSHEKIAEHLAWADLFILTSRYESMAVVIIEAMASGLLCASTRVGIMSDLGDEFGIVVEVGDHKLLAEKIIEITKNDILWKSKVDASIRWSQLHDFAWRIQELNKLILSTIDDKR